MIPVFKTDDPKEISNYHPISVLPSFLKILERIMHNCIFTYLVNETILYSKHFGFQKGHSTEHAIAQLVDQSHELFENGNYTLGVSIDFSRLLTMEYYLKSLQIMEFRVQILPSSEIT